MQQKSSSVKMDFFVFPNFFKMIKFTVSVKIHTLPVRFHIRFGASLQDSRS